MSEASEFPSESRDWREQLLRAPPEALLLLGERRDAPSSCETPLEICEISEAFIGVRIDPAPLGALSSCGAAASVASPPPRCRWAGWAE